VSLMEGVCVTNPVGHTHMLCCGCTRTTSWAFVHCVGALSSLISLWLMWHVVVLPKFIKGLFLVSSDNAYMGMMIGTIRWMPPCYSCDDFESIIW